MNTQTFFKFGAILFHYLNQLNPILNTQNNQSSHQNHRRFGERFFSTVAEFIVASETFRTGKKILKKNWLHNLCYLLLVISQISSTEIRIAWLTSHTPAIVLFVVQRICKLLNSLIIILKKNFIQIYLGWWFLNSILGSHCCGQVRSFQRSSK